MAVDGKSMRGAAEPHDRRINLLAAVGHAAPVVLARLDAGEKPTVYDIDKPATASAARSVSLPRG